MKNFKSLQGVSMKTSLLTLSIFGMAMASSTAFAKGETDSTFERLTTNVNNSKENLEDYKKNLVVVQQNLAEATKAKNAAEAEKKDVSTSLKEAKGTLGKLDSQEKEINGLMSSDKNQISAEEKKLHELEAMIEKIKENKTKREANIQNYQQQLQAMESDRKNWQSRADQLKDQESQAQSRVKQLQAMESQWATKKKSNEAEIIHWTHETERQQKSLQHFQSLADSAK